MDEYEVAAFDMRGYGESEIPKVRCCSVRLMTSFSLRKIA